MKVCFICFDFKRQNIRKQPWRYIYEIAKGFTKQGVDSIIITNSEEDSFDSIKIRHVKSLRSFIGETREVATIINEENPEIIIIVLGMTSFFRFSFPFNKPVIGVLTSPLYSVPEVLSVGLSELILHRKYLVIHLVGAFVPHFLIKKWASHYKKIVVLSENNRRRFQKYYPASNILVIPPGIEELFLTQVDPKNVQSLKNEINSENYPILLYFTSPLTLRGTDTLLKAFAEVRKNIPSKLLFLSRPDDGEMQKEDNLLKNIAERKNITDSVLFINRNLSPDELKNYLSIADVICLPFKIVLSDVPISILEAMAMGKPVISTNIDGIPDLIENRGIIVTPNNYKELALKIREILEDSDLIFNIGNNGKLLMVKYPRWESVVHQFKNLFKEISSREHE